MNNRGKILYIITKSDWGGATKYTFDLAAAMQRHGIETHVAAGPAQASGKNLFTELAPHDVCCHAVKHFQKSVNPLKDVFALYEIITIIRKIKPDILHASSSKAGGLAGIAVRILRILFPGKYNIKTVFTAHGWAYHENRPLWQKSLIKLFSRLTVAFYDQVITVSEFDRQSAARNRIGSLSKFVTVHNGIDAASLVFSDKNEARAALAPQADARKVWVGTIGEFTRNKGHAFLIGAAHLLCDVTDAVFIIVGHRGEEKQNLLRRIAKSGLIGRVFLVDSPPDAARYLKAFDIFVLPSLKEGLPYVLLEAGLAELPSVATDAGGIGEIIDDMLSGLLVSAQNSQALADAITKLLGDKNLCLKLAQNLRKKVHAEFSLSRMAAETLAVYGLK